MTQSNSTLPQGFKRILGSLLLMMSIGLVCLWGLIA